MKRLSVLLLAMSLLVPAARSSAADLPPPDILVAQPLIYAGKLAAFGIMAGSFVLDAVFGAPTACVTEMIGDQSVDGCAAGAQKAHSGGKHALCQGFGLFSEIWGSGPCATAE
jgi:hypothetical protein